jgi:hypothetical protein
MATHNRVDRGFGFVGAVAYPDFVLGCCLTDWALGLSIGDRHHSKFL